MADDNKISIDLDIKTDGQNQINQYTQAFNNLRDSVNGLSSPISTFSNNISSLNDNLSKYNNSLSKLNTQHQEIISSSEKTDNKISALSTSFSTWGNILKLLEQGILNWTSALTGGLAIVTVFLPEIINFASALFKGKDAIDQAKISLNELNKGLSSTNYTKAIEQVNAFKLNVGLARKGLIDKKEVLQQYNDSLGQTIGKVSDLNNLESKLVKGGDAYIKMTLYKATAQLALQDAAKKAYEAEQIRLKSDDDTLTTWDKFVDFWNRAPIETEGSAALA